MRDWPAASVENFDPLKLTPSPRNARTHSAEQVRQLAESIRHWGFTQPILVDEAGGILAGHGRHAAAKVLGLKAVPCVVARGWSEAEKRAYVLADNRLAERAGWDVEALNLELADLSQSFDLNLAGFTPRDVEKITGKGERTRERLEGADDFAAVKDATTTRRGDVWILGDHRLACGDSTDAATVRALMRDDVADLIHADPPYGMGKVKEGVQNDDLTGGHLDAFQLDWLRLALAHARENASLYVWGNAPDLWRLWYRGGLEALDGGSLRVQCEVVWSKGVAVGAGSGGSHTFQPETERCLFLQRGSQYVGNQNTADYWEGHEPLRLWLVEQRDREGWKPADVDRITGVRMNGHWFTRSQFNPIARGPYEKLRAAATRGGFALEFEDLRREFAACFDGSRRRQLSAEMRDRRSYFDGAHDKFTDVWQFPSVKGADRFGHATPKPAAMIGRAIVTSCPEGGLVFEPFSGTGTTLVAAEATGRKCFALELAPAYVDVAVRRWQDMAKRAAVLEGDGRSFDAVLAERGRK